MVGIVIVAHSAQLAENVVEQSKLMLQQPSPIAAAGGTGDPENPFGTNALKIQQAIESVYSEDGVMVLMDLGSAILSAETALEFLTAEQRTKVRLCEAPLVEGAVAAAVQAAGGGSLDEVMREALGSLAAKTAQLRGDSSPVETQPDVVSESPSHELRLKIQNRLGIHARPAAKFVTAASRFKADIKICNATRNTPSVSAKSLNLIATLGIRQGQEIIISAAGVDAVEALSALKSLVERKFDEADEDLKAPGPAETSPKPAGKNKLTGIPIAPGIVVGKVVFYRTPVPEVPDRQIESRDAECQMFQAAISSVKQDLKASRSRMAGSAGEYEASIFDAHLLCLDDPAVLEVVRQEVFERGQKAEAAWIKVIDKVINSYQSLDDPYLRSRSADLIDLKVQVLQKLTGNVPAAFKPAEPAVLIAADLKPSDIARLDSDNILALCTASGTSNSHSAILARALGIPVVFGLGIGITSFPEDALVVVNGNEGWMQVNPGDIEVYRKQQKEWRHSQKTEMETSQNSAVTADGKSVPVLANIGSEGEARRAVRNGAEGIGLLRTEFLFLDRPGAPSEEEQFVAYQNIAEKFGQLPVNIRTLDVGGDKILPYLRQSAGDNPFLGERGIRLSLNNPELFKAQLRAILRVSVRYNIRIMFPMVSTITELRQAKSILTDMKNQLEKSGQLFDKCLKIGVMVETPSAAIMAEQLAREVDFFSIGTNDLTQYILAADRTNSSMASISDPFHPAVLRMIQQTVKAAHNVGIPVGVCGEMAGQKLAIPLLIGLGVDNLSLNISAIAGIKRMITQIKMSDMEIVAAKVLDFDSGEEVRRYTTEQFSNNLI